MTVATDSSELLQDRSALSAEAGATVAVNQKPSPLVTSTLETSRVTAVTGMAARPSWVTVKDFVTSPDTRETTVLRLSRDGLRRTDRTISPSPPAPPAAELDNQKGAALVSSIRTDQAWAEWNFTVTDAASDETWAPPENKDALSEDGVISAATSSLPLQPDRRATAARSIRIGVLDCIRVFG